MSALDDDPIWPHFRPLWCDLYQLAREQLTIAGGYGLYLKQNWLIENSDLPTVIPVTQWPNDTPRATKDVDLVVGLDLIANQDLQPVVLQKLTDCGFLAAEKRDDQFWTFHKSIPPLDNSIIIELHAPTPPVDHPHLTINRKKIRFKEPLADASYDARHTPASASFDRHPFPFELNGTALTVVNPVTWASMKLLAMHNHRQDSQREEISSERRDYHQNQADKHARDIFRIVAMVTREERDRAEEIAAGLKSEPIIEQVSSVYQDDFGTNGWALRTVTPNWQAASVPVIQSVLNSWYLP